MNDSERLLEVLDTCEGIIRNLGYTYDDIVDYLIAHGVTVQKHGRWLDGRCTNCAEEALEYVDDEGYIIVYTTDYCPNCGAKMDLEVEDG